MQKFKNWFNQKTQSHIEHREQSGNFIGDYENNPNLRKRWLRVDIIGLVIFIIALVVMVSGVFDDEPPPDDNIPNPAATDEPTDATPSPPTSNLLGAVIPAAAMPDQSRVSTWRLPAANLAG